MKNTEKRASAKTAAVLLFLPGSVSDAHKKAFPAERKTASE